MGCASSTEIDAITGRPKCDATVRRRLLIFVQKPNKSWRGQPQPGVHYKMDQDLGFDATDLIGYRIARPMECSLELASAVNKYLSEYCSGGWTFICEVRDGSRKMLPSLQLAQVERVLIQSVSSCQCKSPENHDITSTAEGEERMGGGNGSRDGYSDVPAMDIMEAEEEPPRYSKKS